MPFTQLEDNSGENLGKAIGTAAGYFATRKQRASEQQQADAERAQRLADNVQASTERQTAFNTAQDVANREAVARTTMEQTIGKQPDYDPKNPAPYIAYATKASAYFANQGLAGTDSGKYWSVESNKLPLGYQQFTGGQRNVASADLSKARAAVTMQWRSIADYKFKQELEKLKLTQQGRARIAQANQAGAFARAQLRGKAGSSYKPDERETIALMAELNAANGQEQAEAYESAKIKYNSQLEQWKLDREQGEKEEAAGETPNANANAPMPQFIAPPAQAPTIIYVQGPNGNYVPEVLRSAQQNIQHPTINNRGSHQNAGGGGSNNTPPTPPQPQSSGFNIFNPSTWFHHDSAPQAPSRTPKFSSKNKEGQAIYSDDGIHWRPNP